MVKLRLKRCGRKGQITYRIVLINSRSRRDGRPICEVGFYNPQTKETFLKPELIKKSIANGAQPTLTVSNILKKAKLL
uniref:Ribosomal protein S16 n=1 Tax=Gloeochaete wittrockiana TaxID=38269 RepID=A0A3G1IWB5_9EUKA|nr:ribosomal protein S16 [Gloeochaete wittrockiana]ASQ40252.1 ribosomal protein S16 [Gloeochaete wittrockiana]